MSRAASPPSGWEGLLDPGETILWQGRPDRGFHVAPNRYFLAAFGIAFGGFALFWMTMAAQAGGTFWMFGLLHFSVGLGIIFGALFWDTFRRRRTWYTLTDRRAFIATKIPVRGRSIKSYPIRPDTPLDIQQGPLTSLHFATERRRSKNSSYTVPIGFERIPDGESVLQLLRQVQRQQN